MRIQPLRREILGPVPCVDRRGALVVWSDRVAMGDAPWGLRWRFK